MIINAGTTGIGGTYYLYQNGVPKAYFSYGPTAAGIGFTGSLGYSSDLVTTQATFDAQGRWSQYNSVNADSSHNGTPFTIGHASATTQSANLAASQTFSPAVSSATAGRYRICANINITRAATTSSTVPSLVMAYTDPTDSLLKNATVPLGSSTGNATNVGAGGCGLLNAKAATTIQWGTTGYASSGGTSMQYDVYVTLEML